MKDNRYLKKVIKADVVVTGAGISGMMAAISSARQGAKTILVERHGTPGGNVGPGVIVGGHPFGEVDCTLKGGAAGICKEFLDDFNKLGKLFVTSYPGQASIMSYIGMKKLKEAGVISLLSSYASDPIMNGNKVEGVFVESVSGRIKIEAPVVIDATGIGEIAMRAGAKIMKDMIVDDTYSLIMRPRLLDKNFKSWNEGALLMVMSNTFFKPFERACIEKTEFTADEMAWIKEKPKELQQYLLKIEPCIMEAVIEEYDTGNFRMVKKLSEKVILTQPNKIVNLGNQMTSIRVQVHGEFDSLDVMQMSEIEAELRMHIFETMVFFKKHVKGFENAELIIVSPLLGTRGGPCIKGRHLLTIQESYDGAKFDDVMFINIHEGEHGGNRDGYDVPYSMLLPEKIEGLIVSGRAASYLRRGHDPTGIRCRPSMMIIGQCAGIAAAIAVKSGVFPSQIEVKQLQKELLKNGINMGDDERLRELGLFGI